MKNAKIRAEIQRHDLDWVDVCRALKYSWSKFHTELTTREISPPMRRKVERAIVRLARDGDDKQIDGAFGWHEMFRHKVDERK